MNEAEALMNVAIIDWIDSCSSDEMCRAEDVPGPMCCRSIGILVSETDDDVRIALELFGDGRYRTTLAIPKPMIQCITRIPLAPADTESQQLQEGE